MPSLRQRLGRKRNKTPKKAKSTGDLDNTGGSDTNLEMSKEYASQISDVGSAVDDISCADSVSYVSSSTDHVAKKKRFSLKKIRRSFSRKKKSDNSDADKITSLVETSNGAVVLVQEIAEKGNKNSIQAGGGESELSQPNTEGTSHVASKQSSTDDHSVSTNGRDNVDQWRMSGLLDTVQRSNSMHSGSSGTNLAISPGENGSEKKPDTNIPDEIVTSTPKGKEASVPVINFDLVADTPLESREKIISDEVTGECTADQNVEKIENGNWHVHCTASNKSEIIGTKDLKDTSAVKDKNDAKNSPEQEEEKFVETHNLDYEYSSQDTKVDGPEAKSEVNSDDTKVEKPSTQTKLRLNVRFQHGSAQSNDAKASDAGNIAIVRALHEVLQTGEMKINQDILNNEWLVVNLAQNDWVIVDYNEADGEIIEIYDRPVEVA